MDNLSYRARLKGEREVFAENINVHDLPDIFHYWSNKYLRPKTEALGISDIYAVFVDPISKLARSRANVVKVASLGAGNCDYEVEIVKQLVARCDTKIQMDCYELNEDMLQRGRELASKEGLVKYMRFRQADLNKGDIEENYDVFIANQILHHIVELENVFETIRKNLVSDGYFVVNDVIGRNGHMYWPEAYAIVCDLWRLLPHKYKYNHQLKRFEDPYSNVDCSLYSFEGIRAQDILPLLVKFFEFELFIGFGNLINVFVDRSFGHNFDRDDPFDRAFIDFVAELDERLLKEGQLKPTHLIAWMKKEKPGDVLAVEGQIPEKCIREPSISKWDAPKEELRRFVTRVRGLVGRL